MWLHMAPPTDQTDVYLEGSPVDRFLFTTLLAIGCWVLIMRGRRVTRLLSVNWPILLFFLYCALSAVWSDYPEVAFKRWIKALGDLVMVLVVLTDSDRFAAIKRLLSRAVFLLVPTSILLIRYYPELGRSYDPWTGKPYYTGVTLNKQQLGIVCLIFGLGSLWRVLDALRGRAHIGRTGTLIAHGAILAMIMWLFWMVNSVTGFSCLLMASTVMIATGSRVVRRQRWSVHLLVAAV